MQNIKLEQKQTQNLVLAPQLRQSLKILQAPAISLKDVIQEELQTNPILEESLDDSEKNSSDREEEILDYLNSYSGTNSSQFSADDEKKRQYFFDSIPIQETLYEHLIAQAKLLDCSKEELEATEFIIGNLDERGFLISKTDELSANFSSDLLKNKTKSEKQELLSKALDFIKKMDPIGVGCSSIQETLLSQLEQNNNFAFDNTLKNLAIKILKENYELLLRKRLPELSKIYDVKVFEIQEVMSLISRLDPSPGRQFSHEINPTVLPDVSVFKDENKWKVFVHNEYIPRLQINPLYKRLISNEHLTENERDYLKGKVQSGRFLMHAIEQRQLTLERMTWEILDLQKDFFEYGKSHLKPLKMQKIANLLGVHETTISRAVANKYMQTPFGIFEFKYFFMGGLVNDQGDFVASKTIKERIKHLISSEDKNRPLSDQKIVEILQKESIEIARRTVAKYREELNILPTNLRREYSDNNLK